MAKTPAVLRKAQTLDIQMDKAATFRAAIIWKIGDPLIPKDLTGYTARMTIRTESAPDDVLFTMTTEDGGLAIEALNGKISFFIADDDVGTFEFEEAVYDLEMIDTGGSGDVRRFVEGAVIMFLKR